MKTLFCIAVGVLVLSANEGAAQTKRCEVPPFHTADHQTVDGRMMVKAGAQCTVRMGVEIGGFSDAQILKQPKRGTVVVRAYDIIYTPNKNYVGSDEFTYVRNSIDRYGKKAPRTVNMKVEVLP